MSSERSSVGIGGTALASKLQLLSQETRGEIDRWVAKFPPGSREIRWRQSFGMIVTKIGAKVISHEPADAVSGDFGHEPFNLVELGP